MVLSIILTSAVHRPETFMLTMVETNMYIQSPSHQMTLFIPSFIQIYELVQNV